MAAPERTSSSEPPARAAPGEEWVTAHCTGCERTWEAHGTLESRRTIDRIQKHADRMQHRVDVQHANRR